jgi:hypothetical protein
MPLSAESRYVLVRVKIERAKQHLAGLKTAVQKYEGASQTVFISRDEPTPTAYVPLVDLPKQSFDALACAGEIVHNLRTALDHLAGQLVLAAGNQPTKGVTGFPIAESIAGYESIKGRKVKGMRTQAIERIDAFMPYKGGNDEFWRIHELDNIDKHRTLLTAHRNCLFVADWLPGNEPYYLKSGDPDFLGFVEDNNEQDLEFEVEELLGQLQVVQTGALLPSMNQLINFIEGVAISFKTDLG